MGPGEAASPTDCEIAEHLGELIARQGWVTLTGGRPTGVMDAALRGASRTGGLTIGVLPSDTSAAASEWASLRIVTGMGEARNIVNVLTSQILFVCGMNAGTASEVAFALKIGRHTILLNAGPGSLQFWPALGEKFFHAASSPEEAIGIARDILDRQAQQ